MPGRSSPLVARIVQVAVILGCLGGVLWVGAQLFEPAPVPPIPPAQRAVKFDPKVDVSQHPIFGGLQPYGPTEVLPGETGRQNPFLPVPVVHATSTATSTAEVPAPLSPTTTTNEPEPSAPEPTP
ncbi:hypothetical protein HY479_02825 [Candidatus Uhrbacteria bacterium]|nr:hypothetical protein [Candidatus Uhrbacteria bacterium]